MSIERNRFEADRWLRTALDDLDTASILLQNRKHAHACFHAQQAGEKALKALWYASDADPWGHSIKKLIDDLERVDLDLRKELGDLDRSALFLDRFYVPTRYPNGLPEITPDIAFTAEDAGTCIEHAGSILARVQHLLERSR